MRKLILCISPLAALCFIISLETLFNSVAGELGEWPAFAAVSAKDTGFPPLLKIADVSFITFLLSAVPSVVLLALWAKKVGDSKKIAVFHLVCLLTFVIEMTRSAAWWYTD